MLRSYRRWRMRNLIGKLTRMAERMPAADLIGIQGVHAVRVDNETGNIEQVGTRLAQLN